MDLYNASQGQEADEEVGITLEEYEEQRHFHTMIVKRGDAAIRLANNPDFKDLVIDGYFDAEVRRLANLMATANVAKSVIDGCSDSIAAVGKFRAFMKIMTDARTSSASELEALEEARAESILAEAEA